MNSHPERSELEAFDSLTGERRAIVLRHVRDCPECARELFTADPTRRFALLSLEPIPAEALDRLSRRVLAKIDDREGRSASYRWRALAALAASLVLATLFGLDSFRRPGPSDLPGSSVAARREASQADPRSGEIERMLQDAAPVAGIQVISSPGEAQVLDLSVGDTQVVMIFDKRLDL